METSERKIRLTFLIACSLLISAACFAQGNVIMPWYEEHNQTRTLIYGEQSVVFPTAPTGYVFPGDPGVPTTVAPTRDNNFSTFGQFISAMPPRLVQVSLKFHF